MIASDYTVCALATLMFNEPKDEGILGATACGLVIRNRVLAGWESQNWLAVIQNHDKYATEPERVLRLGDHIRDDYFRRCLAIATNIFEGRERDITCGALRYCRLDQASEKFVNTIVRPTRINPENGATEQIHPRVATIGKRQYFK